LSAARHEATGLDRAQLDITDFAAARSVIAGLKPNLVIHTAAWTDVDGCARDPEKAILVNGFGAQHVALGAAAVGAAILYVSSNEVFDGRSRPMRTRPAPIVLIANGSANRPSRTSTRSTPSSARRGFSRTAAGTSSSPC
jgi:dTDP-4-dehydrorhamnose reductase